MSDPSNYDRRGASQASQMIWMEDRIKDLEAELAVAKDSADKWFTKCRAAEAEVTDKSCLLKTAMLLVSGRGEAIEKLEAELAQLKPYLETLKKCEKKDGYTIVDFQHVWLEQERDKSRKLETELQKETENSLNQHDLWIKEKNRTLELEAELVKAGSDIAGFSNQLLESQVACQKRGAELAKAKDAARRTFHEVEQTLGKALGYPWFKDDPKNFPDATEADGVCVGEHVPESIALEVANKIKELEAELSKVKSAERKHEIWAAEAQGDSEGARMICEELQSDNTRLRECLKTLLGTSRLQRDHDLLKIIKEGLECQTLEEK